jgi:DNA ligase-1
LTVFDTPSLHDKQFEERIHALESYFATNPAPYIRVIKHSKCNGVNHLREVLKQIEAEGGEGVMLRAPHSFYEFKR